MTSLALRWSVAGAVSSGAVSREIGLLLLFFMLLLFICRSVYLFVYPWSVQVWSSENCCCGVLIVVLAICLYLLHTLYCDFLGILSVSVIITALVSCTLFYYVFLIILTVCVVITALTACTLFYYDFLVILYYYYRCNYFCLLSPLSNSRFPFLSLAGAVSRRCGLSGLVMVARGRGGGEAGAGEGV